MLQSSPLSKATPRIGIIGTETWSPVGVKKVDAGWQILGSPGETSQGIEWPDMGYGLFRWTVKSFNPRGIDRRQLFGFWTGGPQEGLDIEFRTEGNDPNQPGIYFVCWQDGKVMAQATCPYIPLFDTWRITIDYQANRFYGSVDGLREDGTWLNVDNHTFEGNFAPGQTLRCGQIWPFDCKPYSHPLVSGFLVSDLEINPKV